MLKIFKITLIILGLLMFLVGCESGENLVDESQPENTIEVDSDIVRNYGLLYLSKDLGVLLIESNGKYYIQNDWKLKELVTIEPNSEIAQAKEIMYQRIEETGYQEYLDEYVLHAIYNGLAYNDIENYMNILEKNYETWLTSKVVTQQTKEKNDIQSNETKESNSPQISEFSKCKDCEARYLPTLEGDEYMCGTCLEITNLEPNSEDLGEHIDNIEIPCMACGMGEALNFVRPDFIICNKCLGF